MKTSLKELSPKDRTDIALKVSALLDEQLAGVAPGRRYHEVNRVFAIVTNARSDVS